MGSGFLFFFFFFSGKATAAHYDARFDTWGLLVAISLPDLLSGRNVTGICPGSSEQAGPLQCSRQQLLLLEKDAAFTCA